MHKHAFYYLQKRGVMKDTFLVLLGSQSLQIQKCRRINNAEIDVVPIGITNNVNNRSIIQ